MGLLPAIRHDARAITTFGSNSREPPARCLGHLSMHALTKGCLFPARHDGEALDPYLHPGAHPEAMKLLV
jgi:hypothetical protein